MPLLLFPIAAIFLGLVLVFLTPFSIYWRYRAGTARRKARRWEVAINVFGLTLSIAIFFLSTAVANVWVPRALVFSALGLGSGLALGIVGLVLTRWEATPGSLHFTPNRWLVLLITLAVTGRIAFGLWRAWHAWHVAPEADGWLAASGLAGSMAAGALILGYYLCFWTGVWLRLTRHKASGLARPGL